MGQGILLQGKAFGGEGEVILIQDMIEHCIHS